MTLRKMYCGSGEEFPGMNGVGPRNQHGERYGRDG